MTNREYLSQNPEEMRDMMQKAKEYVEKEYGIHKRMIITDDELLDKWLDSEREVKVAPTNEKAYIVNIALTIHHANEMNRDEAQQVGKIVAKFIECAKMQLPSIRGIDNVTVEKVKEFVFD